ncbi:MAG: SDR family oxidoreductase [Verrucomicrobiae bacterium]|nr:SDR family oxidoreductase [Verrucomicrobiae bacterium]
MELRNQVVWITGASQGIGRAAAEAFAGAGAVVILTARREGILQAFAHEFRQKGFKAFVLPGDVSRPDVVERIAEQIAKQFGRLDVLINNAGVLTPRKRIHEIIPDEWTTTMAINLRGVFLCERAALQLMLRDSKGVIVNVSSGAGKNPVATWGAYAVAKAGVEMLTKVSAQDYKDTGIRFYAFNPGGTRTQMRAAAYPDEDSSKLKAPDKVAEFLLQLVSGEPGYPNGASVDYV